MQSDLLDIEPDDTVVVAALLMFWDPAMAHVLCTDGLLLRKLQELTIDTIDALLVRVLPDIAARSSSPRAGSADSHPRLQPPAATAGIAAQLQAMPRSTVRCAVAEQVPRWAGDDNDDDDDNDEDVDTDSPEEEAKRKALRWRLCVQTSRGT